MKNKCLKSVASVLIITTFFSLLACSKGRKTDFSPVSSQKTTQAEATTVEKTEPVQKPTEETTTAKAKAESTYSLRRYDHLSSEEKAVYNSLKKSFDEKKNSLQETASEFKSEIVDRTFYYSFLIDNPEYIDVRGNSISLENVDLGTKVFRFDIKYIYSDSAFADRMHRIDAIFKLISSKLPKNCSDFDKAKAVYDYLIDNCSYDNSYTGNSQKESNTTASFADGALLDKKAVCSGYSRAFKLMMDKFGIACTCICNDEHEWNLVFIDGNYYHIDVTWADDGSSDRYKYFCVSDGTIYKNHKKALGDLPKCNINF